VCLVGSYDAGYVFGNTGFLCYTNYHSLFLFLFAKVQQNNEKVIISFSFLFSKDKIFRKIVALNPRSPAEVN